MDDKSNTNGGLLDLSKYRLNQNFSELTRTEKILTHVPVQRPAKHQFFQVHPSEDYRLPVTVVEFSKETYLIDNDLVSAIPDLCKPVRLHLYVTRQGSIGIWPVKLPIDDGRGRVSAWHSSALQAVDIAMEQWVRLIPNMEAGFYDVYKAINIPVDPAWPKSKSMLELVTIGFQGHVIDSEDNPVLQELLGLS